MHRTIIVSLAAALLSGLAVPAAAPAPLKPGQRPRLVAQLGHAGAVNTGSNDGMAQLWDTASGRELRSLEGHTSAVMSVALALSGFNPRGWG